MNSPWSAAGMQQAWFGLQQACLTRPEAWLAWWEFQDWVGRGIGPVIDDKCVDLTAQDTTSFSSAVVATRAKSAPAAKAAPSARASPSDKAVSLSPRSPPTKKAKTAEPFIPKAPLTPPTSTQRELQGGGNAFAMPSGSHGGSEEPDDRGYEEPEDRGHEEPDDRGSARGCGELGWEEPDDRGHEEDHDWDSDRGCDVETSMPRAWHMVLRNFNVDAAAVLQLELLHSSGDRGADAASEIVWKLSKERRGGSSIHNGSGFISRCVTTARKDLHGSTRGSWKW